MKPHALFFLIALSGYGCATKKLVLENADTLITYQINRRLPLNSAQKKALSKDIDQFLNNTRPLAQEIIPIADELKLSESEKLDAQFIKLESYYKKLAADFTALLSKYLAKLDEDQQKELFETLDEENKKLAKSKKEDQREKIEDRFEKVMGSINRGQKELTKEYADYFIERSKLRLDLRIKLQQDLREIYEQKLTESNKMTQIHELFLKFQKATLVGNKNQEILKRIVPTLSNEQREHFRGEVKEIKDLLKYFKTITY